MAAGRDFERMQDYLVGRLSDDELRVFEDRLLREPALVRELEESLRIREGLQQLRSKGYFASAAYRAGSFRTWQTVLAAAVIAGLALFLSWQRAMGPSPVLIKTVESLSGPHGRPLVSAHFTFIQVRGDSTPDLELPSAGVIEIRAAPATLLADSRYRVTLTRLDHEGSAKPVGVLAAVALSSDGYLHFFAECSRLTAGSYLLRIEPDKAGADTAQFRFNLVAVSNQPSQ